MSFTIPIRPGGASSEPNGYVSSQRILVVDDDADIRQLLSDRLRAGGYQPCLAIDGLQALSAVRAESFGGMILDIGIGQIDGLEVLRQVRVWNQQLPIIMITASGSQELAIKAIGMGAQAYLLKPFDAGELQYAMDAWFRRG
jgi:DNA-binding response OmpR family regulator